MRPSRGMGAIAPSKMPKARNVIKRDGKEPVKVFKQGGKVRSLMRVAFLTEKRLVGAFLGGQVISTLQIMPLILRGISYEIYALT